MLPLRKILPLAALPASLALTSPARATFSIVAADAGTSAIGSAGASCVPYEVIRILRVAPARGLIVGQAYFDDAALDEAEEMLASGQEPAAVLDAITDASTFPNAPRMQYGIVDVVGRTASITGPEATPYAADLAGSSGSVTFTVQGNLLTGPEVLSGMASAAEGGCDLPERLVRALEAAGEDGGGDSRCTDGGISAASAYVLVAWKDGTELRISLPDVRPADPVAALRGELDAWRAEHPCPAADGPPEDDAPADHGVPSGCYMSTTPRPATAKLSAAALAFLLLSARSWKRWRRAQDVSRLRPSAPC